FPNRSKNLLTVPFEHLQFSATRRSERMPRPPSMHAKPCSCGDRRENSGPTNNNHQQTSTTSAAANVPCETPSASSERFRQKIPWNDCCRSTHFDRPSSRTRCPASAGRRSRSQRSQAQRNPRRSTRAAARRLGSFQLFLDPPQRIE